MSELLWYAFVSGILANHTLGCSLDLHSTLYPVSPDGGVHQIPTNQYDRQGQFPRKRTLSCLALVSALPRDKDRESTLIAHTLRLTAWPTEELSPSPAVRDARVSFVSGSWLSTWIWIRHSRLISTLRFRTWPALVSCARCLALGGNRVGKSGRWTEGGGAAFSAVLSLDVMDISGNQHLDVSHTVYKVPHEQPMFLPLF